MTSVFTRESRLALRIASIVSRSVGGCCPNGLNRSIGSISLERRVELAGTAWRSIGTDGGAAVASVSSTMQHDRDADREEDQQQDDDQAAT